MYITKTRDLAKICEKTKENRRVYWTSDFGLSDKTWTCGLYHPNGVWKVCKSANIVEYLPLSLIFSGFSATFRKISSAEKMYTVQEKYHLVPKSCTGFFCISRLLWLLLKGIISHFSPKIKCGIVLFWKLTIWLPMKPCFNHYLSWQIVYGGLVSSRRIFM